MSNIRSVKSCFRYSIFFIQAALFVHACVESREKLFRSSCVSWSGRPTLKVYIFLGLIKIILSWSCKERNATTANRLSELTAAVPTVAPRVCEVDGVFAEISCPCDMFVSSANNRFGGKYSFYAFRSVSHCRTLQFVNTVGLA